MDTILQGVQELEGVLAALAINGAGQVVAYKAHSVYDIDLLKQTARHVAKAIDSIQLLEENWEGVTVNYTDGRLLLRNLVGKDGPPKNGLIALAVVADGRLSLSFAGVALRVAVTKLKNAALAPTSLGTSSAMGGASAPAVHGAPGGAGSNVRMPAPGLQPQGSRPDIAGSGLSWSGLGGSSLAASGVTVTDAGAAAFLNGCTMALTRCLGPLAKAVVKESILKLWPDRPFSRDLGPMLAAELEKHIESPREQAQFRNAIKSL